MRSESGQRIAVVTGGTGFVGSHLVRRLVADGWHVHVIVRPGSDTSRLDACDAPPGIHVHDGSTEGLASYFESVRPAVVFHLASLYRVEHEPKDVLPLVESNVVFGTQLLDAMSRAQCGRLVNTGTAWQHYESRDYSPVNLYAATKQAFESILQYYVEARAVSAVTLKLHDTFGPNDPRKKLFTLLAETARRGAPLAMSAGEQQLELVHVDDVVDALLIAAARLEAGDVRGHECYTVASGAPRRLRDVVTCYEEITGERLPIQWGGRPYRTREVMVPWTAGPTLPGWSPTRSLEDWLRDDYRKRQAAGAHDGD